MNDAVVRVIDSEYTAMGDAFFDLGRASAAAQGRLAQEGRLGLFSRDVGYNEEPVTG